MKPSRALAPFVTFLLAAPALFAEPSVTLQRGGIVRKGVTATSYSVEVPVVTRVVGTALFRTAIDISNNTNTNGVVAEFQYSYNCLAGACNGGFFRTAPQTLTLLAVDNFHQDDFVQYLGSLGLLQSGAAEASFGTLLVTFSGLPSSLGAEASVTARTYSPAPVGGGTNGISYYGSLFFESADTTLVGTARDTRAAPTQAGALRTNVGVRNTDIRGSTSNVTVQLEFYDVTEGSPTNGQRVGDRLNLNDIRPGEARQVNNIFDAARISATAPAARAVIVFADVISPTPSATGNVPTIEGYIVVLEGSTQDGSFFDLKCADVAAGSGNAPACGS